MTHFLCLWLPNWPIQRLLRSRPELNGRPVALVASGPRGGLVAACCGAAATQGVRPDMPLAEAQALARELAAAPHEPPADRRALEKLAEACERFTPCVALEEGDEPESLLLDISDLEHLYGSGAKLAAEVEKSFVRCGYRVRIAVADTVGLAWALAHFAEEDCKMQMADSPVPSPQPPAPYFQLPVEALRIAHDTTALLGELGIETVGQLLSLPREGLASRFDDQLLRRLDQLTGAAPEVIEPHRGLAPLEAACALDEPTADRAVLMHVLSQVVERLAGQLAARDQGAVLLMCVLHSASGTLGVCDGRGEPKRTSGRALPLRIGLLEPSADPRQLLELIELHLETVTLSDEVDRVEIRAIVVGRLGQRQRELFADRWPTDPHQLALLVNRLSSRLGYERVVKAELRASPVPERAVRFVPITERVIRKLQKAKCKKQNANWKAARNRNPPISAIENCNLQFPRPLALHPRPQSLEVVCVAPAGPPQFVWLDRRRQRIVHCAGPERIETLWWRGPSVRRDYYRVATESGSHLWIFRRLTDARWFLHGVFA